MSNNSGQVKRPARPKPLGHDPRRLKARRRVAGLTQVAVAQSVGCTNAHICQLESGANGASPELLAALADLYGCRMTDLMPARRKALMERFAQQADPGGRLSAAERDIRAYNLVADYLQNGDPEENGAAA